VLKLVDSFSAWLTWVAALLVAVMLVVGPRIVAHDKAKQTTYSAGAASRGGPNGKAVFTSTCGSCHTLKAAGTSGTVGPNLDNISLGAADIEKIVRSGRGAMPAQGDKLSKAEISAVAAYVARQH
jgi:mono/diheme cytochrome c family protein